MVNNTSNRLWLKGKKDTVKEFIKKNVINNKLDFSVSVPADTDLRLDRAELWGTPGDRSNSDCIIDKYMGYMYIEFLTEWDPPLKWLRATAKLWPNLEFHLAWYELGMRGYGITKIHYDDYDIEKKYQLRGDDIEYEFESGDENGDLGHEQSAGRFAKVIGKVGMVYEAN